MNNDEVRNLCTALIQADTEADVIRILQDAHLWEEKHLWRMYGDSAGNFSAIGNQQNRPDAALVEKLVNSVDARLLHECLVRGIDPESAAAPQTIREAVAQFFEKGRLPGSVFSGQLRMWDDQLRREVARGITLAASGVRGREGNPAITIVDQGEGQTPLRFPKTFFSLERSNKFRIPFVQGKFSMGGTGVLEFCGRNNLQLVMSRRSPHLLNGSRAHPTDDHWGFTIVRRENPIGNEKCSVYAYLAPVGADVAPRDGNVLSFEAKAMCIFPEGSTPYARDAEWGTLIKMYEYSLPGHRGHILRKDGLLTRLELLLPEVGLPIRLHECRQGYRGHEGSFDTTLTGLGVRLDEGSRADNLEPEFPSSAPLLCSGEKMSATVYAFKKGRSEAYRRSEGIVFTVNGQTHGHLTEEFFKRSAVGLAYLSDSLLVIVDCSEVSARGRELLFMNSRDRLRDNELRKEVEKELEDLLRSHAGLKALRERRRREEIEARLEDSKPLEQVLEQILKHSPTLANLFNVGTHATNPFKQKGTRAEEKPYHGKNYPTFFKLKGKEYGHTLHRDAHINMRCRISFETDAVNDYFSRSIGSGIFELDVNVEGKRVAGKDLGLSYNVNLQNGIAVLSIRWPEQFQVGQTLKLHSSVRDETREEPFEAELEILIQKAVSPSDRPATRRKPPSNEPGKDRETPSGIDLPKWKVVTKDEWATQSPPFDHDTALVIKDTGAAADAKEPEKRQTVYDFYINGDNRHLLRYLKYEANGKAEDRTTKMRFEIGLMLIGLAIIHEEVGLQVRSEKEGGDEVRKGVPSVEERVARVSAALAPFLLPMVDALGALSEEQVVASASAGEST